MGEAIGPYFIPATMIVIVLGAFAIMARNLKGRD